MHFVLREPLGVVGAISPWNYPLLMADVEDRARRWPPATRVVLKPAEQAPMSCLRLAQLFVEAGGPPGVFNVVNGLGESRWPGARTARGRREDHASRVRPRSASSSCSTPGSRT